MALTYVGNSERQTVTLDSAYTAGSGTMTLTSGHGSRLPSSGNFWLITTSGTYRAFKVTARSTDTLTVTAAQDGTSDGNLSGGTELQWSLTASALDEFTAGLGGGVPTWIKPVSTDFTWLNQGTATVSDDAHGMALIVPGNSGVNYIRGLYKTAPSTPYTLDVTFDLLPLIAAFHSRVGILLRESSSGKCLVWCLEHLDQTVSTAQTTIRYESFTNETTLSATIKNRYLGAINGRLILRYHDNGTTRYMYMVDEWSAQQLEFYSEGRTTFCTADQIGVFVTNSSTDKSIGIFRHFYLS